MSTAADLVESSSVEANLALLEKSPDAQRRRLTSARDAAHAANLRAARAVEYGDFLVTVVDDPPGARGYRHYWGLSRVQLDTARAASTRAAGSASLALECTAPACTTTRVGELRTHSLTASKAFRQAETLVRLAMVLMR